MLVYNNLVSQYIYRDPAVNVDSVIDKFGANRPFVLQQIRSYQTKKMNIENVYSEL
jgi:hypothetical protein